MKKKKLSIQTRASKDIELLAYSLVLKRLSVEIRGIVYLDVKDLTCWAYSFASMGQNILVSSGKGGVFITMKMKITNFLLRVQMSI